MVAIFDYDNMGEYQRSGTIGEFTNPFYEFAQDPVSAEHDRRTARPERYWRDMDDDSWDARLMQNLGRVNGYDITGRLNLMAKHVRYVD